MSEIGQSARDSVVGLSLLPGLPESPKSPPPAQSGNVGNDCLMAEGLDQWQGEAGPSQMSPPFSVVKSHLPAHIVFLLLSAIVDINDVEEEVGTLEHLLQWMRGRWVSSLPSLCNPEVPFGV